MGIFDRHRGGTIRIHLLIKGRIGEDWTDIDEHLRLPVGTTLGDLLEVTRTQRIPLREALDNSPDLRDTMMLNGEPCPFEENRERRLADGDKISLLAPLAGG